MGQHRFSLCNLKKVRKWSPVQITQKNNIYIEVICFSSSLFLYLSTSVTLSMLAKKKKKSQNLEVQLLTAIDCQHLKINSQNSILFFLLGFVADFKGHRNSKIDNVLSMVMRPLISSDVTASVTASQLFGFLQFDLPLSITIGFKI